MFVQQGDQCMLSSVMVEEKQVLSHITGKWISPLKLREVLKKAGVNIFPGECSYTYLSLNKKVSPRGDGFPAVFPHLFFPSKACCAESGEKCTTVLTP